jgi:hypothetical protein
MTDTTVTQRFHEWQIEERKNIFSLLTTTVQSLTLVNGGAIVAILAYLGNVSSHDIAGATATKALAATLEPAIQRFAIAVGLALATAAAVLIGHWLLFSQYSREEQHRWGFVVFLGLVMEFLGVCSAGAGVVLFIVGAMGAVRAFAG